MATRNYLNQWWPSLLTPVYVIARSELTFSIMKWSPGVSFKIKFFWLMIIQYIMKWPEVNQNFKISVWYKNYCFHFLYGFAWKLHLVICYNMVKCNITSPKVQHWQTRQHKSPDLELTKTPHMSHSRVCYEVSIKSIYCQVSDIRHTLVGNLIVVYSDVVGALPVGTAPTTSSFST